MSGTDTFYETLAEYLTIRLGQASLSPAETVILVLTLAAALLSALHLWRIGKQEDRRDRLMALRGAPVDRAVRERRPRWYQRLGSIVAASPAVGTAEQITPTIASNSHTETGWLHSARGSTIREISAAIMAPHACWPQANAAGFEEAI